MVVSAHARGTRAATRPRFALVFRRSAVPGANRGQEAAPTGGFFTLISIFIILALFLAYIERQPQQLARP
jgi:hypothetical protein